MKLKIKKLHYAAEIPVYATPGSACFDLHAISDGVVFGDHTKTFRTGLAFEVPDGHVMLIHSRSGHGFKNDIRLANSTGVIDSDYRGEVNIKLTNDSANDFHVKRGDRIAQAMIIPVDAVEFEVVDELSETVRGAGGYGSTGR